MRLFGAILILVAVFLTGCGAPAVRSSQPTANAGKDNGVGPAATDSSPKAKEVLYRFAERVSKQDLDGAADLLGPGLRGVYQFQDYAPIRNTPKMEILEITEEKGERPDLAAVDPKEVVQVHVYQVQVRYKVLGLLPSDFVDGEVYYHKATVVELKDGRWLITELSAARPATR